LQDAVHAAIADGDCTTDLGGTLTTTDFTAAVVDRVG
jgi:isocitrate/isopropylmalate dehydrogenase